MIMEKITYREVNGYMIPNLKLPPQESKVRFGKWGMLHKDYLLKNKKVVFTILLAEGKLWQYLYDIDTQAQQMFDTLVEQMKETEDITEQLKEDNQMEWVQSIFNIHSQARKIVEYEMIFR